MATIHGQSQDLPAGENWSPKCPTAGHSLFYQVNPTVADAIRWGVNVGSRSNWRGCQRMTRCAGVKMTTVWRHSTLTSLVQQYDTMRTGLSYL